MWKRMIGLAAAFAGLFVSPAPAQQTAAPLHAAPAAWVRYAGLVEQGFEDKLGGDSEPAKRLRAYLSGASTGRDVIALAVWVDNKGAVSRVTFAPFLDSQANADMTGLLQGTQLGTVPPAGILLPIHLNLHAAALENSGETAASVAATTTSPSPTPH